MDAYEEFCMDADAYIQDPIEEMFYRMRGNPKYRPVVKKLAKKGDVDCLKVMVLWDAHVKEMRRLHASR